MRRRAGTSGGSGSRTGGEQATLLRTEGEVEDVEVTVDAVAGGAADGTAEGTTGGVAGAGIETVADVDSGLAFSAAATTDDAPDSTLSKGRLMADGGFHPRQSTASAPSPMAEAPRAEAALGEAKQSGDGPPPAESVSRNAEPSNANNVASDAASDTVGEVVGDGSRNGTRREAAPAGKAPPSDVADVGFPQTDGEAAIEESPRKEHAFAFWGVADGGAARRSHEWP